MRHIIERAIVPQNPSSNTLVKEDRYNLFAPAAGKGKVGMAGFDKDDFDVKNQMVSLNKTVKENIATLLTAKENHESRIGSLESRTDALEPTVNSHGKTLGNHEDRIDALEPTVNSHGKMLGNHESRIDSLEPTVNSHGESLNNHEDRIDTLETWNYDQKSVWIKYSRHPDGAHASDIWRPGYDYIGIAVTHNPPTNNDYIWSLFRGEKGEKGDPLRIVKSYPSVAEMNAHYGDTDVAVGHLVAIDTGNVEDADNAKLFLKTVNGFTYVTDLSGKDGIKGDKGDKGESAYQLALNHGFNGTEQEFLDSLHDVTKQLVTTDGQVLKVFVGTHEEYRELPDHTGIFAIITDEYNTENLNYLAEVVAGIVSGTVAVAKADSAEYAEVAALAQNAMSATEANFAITAGSATLANEALQADRALSADGATHAYTATMAETAAHATTAGYIRQTKPSIDIKEATIVDGVPTGVGLLHNTVYIVIAKSDRTVYSGLLYTPYTAGERTRYSCILRDDIVFTVENQTQTILFDKIPDGFKFDKLEFWRLADLREEA